VALITSLAYPVAVFEAHLHPHTLNAPKLGASAIGLTWTPLAGVTAAGGTWWSDSTFRIVSVDIGEASAKPIVKQLNEIANVVVPKFGL
jgi:hypothetical protein